MPLPLLALALLLPALLARRATATRHGAVLLGIAAVTLAMYAGSQVASDLAFGDGRWGTVIVAIAAAMVCGAVLALHCFDRRSRAGTSLDGTLDHTVEMEV